MCRSCAEMEAGTGRRHRRCEVSDLQRKNAARNRRDSFAARDGFLDGVEALYGPEAKAMMDGINPVDMASILAYTETYDPEGAEMLTSEALERSGKNELPGTHMMVLQDTRADSSRTDHDQAGNRKDDQMFLSRNMRRMNALEEAWLNSEDSNELDDEERQRRENALKIRKQAAAAGVFDGKKHDERRDAYLENLSPKDMDELASVHSAMESKVAQEIWDNADISVDVREAAKNAPEMDRTTTVEELLNRCSEEEARIGIPIRDGVWLARTDDGPQWRVTDKHLKKPVMLRARPRARVLDDTASIPRMDSISYDTELASPGWKSMFERYTNKKNESGKDLRAKANEQVIRTAFQSRTRISERRSAKGLLSHTAPGKRKALTANNVLATRRVRAAGDMTKPTDEKTELHRTLMDTQLRTAGLTAQVRNAEVRKRAHADLKQYGKNMKNAGSKYGSAETGVNGSPSPALKGLQDKGTIDLSNRDSVKRAARIANASYKQNGGVRQDATSEEMDALSLRSSMVAHRERLHNKQYKAPSDPHVVETLVDDDDTHMKAYINAVYRRGVNTPINIDRVVIGSTNQPDELSTHDSKGRPRKEGEEVKKMRVRYVSSSGMPLNAEQVAVGVGQSFQPVWAKPGVLTLVDINDLV